MSIKYSLKRKPALSKLVMHVYFVRVCGIFLKLAKDADVKNEPVLLWG
jgi:hypothetical protein